MPPKVAMKSQIEQVIYPPGVKEITDDLGADELIRRLKTCAQSFQNMGQDDDNSEFVALAKHLAKDNFIEHSNKDVRLLIACCVADVFRVFAPEAPYKDPEQIKNIFLFFIKQLKGLADPKDPSFKRYFYLLENLAWVKSFNICIELEDNQEIFCKLFTLMFAIVNDDHSAKVKNFMLDMMAPLISEADSVSQELMDIILLHIIEPRKSHNRNSYCLARDLLKKTSTTIEPCIQNFFNNALILGKTSQSDIAAHIYELIYELNSITPGILLAVLPQLEFKLKSNDEKERLDVCRLLARMFSDKNSKLAYKFKPLWLCFLGRFNDISVAVRNRCVQYSMHFLLNHPDLRDDITEQLKHRQHDPEETVRYEVVMAIISAAKRDFSSINDQLLEFVKERTLDKKFKIRKEALIGLSVIYKKCMNTADIPESTIKCISWIKSKVLHVYYQTALEDRLLVERVLHTCLVPYQLPVEERMKRLYHVYSTVDDHAVKAFNELLKCQNTVRTHLRGLLDLHREEKMLKDEHKTQISQKINLLAKSLPDAVKALEFLKKFDRLIQTDERIRAHLEILMKPDCLCREADENVRDILKKLGNPVMTNVFYTTVKQLLERVAPVLFDRLAIRQLVIYVEKVLDNDSTMLEEIGSEKALERGLNLLLILASVIPTAFNTDEIYRKFLLFLQSNNNRAAELTMQILRNLGNHIVSDHPDISMELIPICRQFATEGTERQAKGAIQCLDVVVASESREDVYNSIIDELKNNLNLDCPHFCTALISMGHIAYFAPNLSLYLTKGIITKNIVQDLLMQNKGIPRETDASWCPEDKLSFETKAKIEGMKFMVRWLLGLKKHSKSACSALRLFNSLIENNGDLLKNDNICRPEMAWLKVTAGCCILKLAQEPSYADCITHEQFQTLSRLIVDTNMSVRERFALKLHYGLISMKLPLQYMAILCLTTQESNRDLKKRFQQYLFANIEKRRDYIRQHQFGEAQANYPDNVIPFAIHLLAHDPDFKKYDQVNVLYKLKDCLWYLLEPLIKNDTYSFGFLKKQIESIKQTKDAQNPEDDMQNMKMFAVCDLALGLVLSKTANFVVKDFPLKPTLPAKLFSEQDEEVINSKIYLPPELASMFPKSLSLDGDHSKNKTAAAPVAKRGRGRAANSVSSSTNEENMGDQEQSLDQENSEMMGETVIVQEVIEDQSLVETLAGELPMGDIIYITTGPVAQGLVDGSNQITGIEMMNVEVSTQENQEVIVKAVPQPTEPRVRPPRKQQLKVSVACIDEDEPMPLLEEEVSSTNDLEIIEEEVVLDDDDKDEENDTSEETEEEIVEETSENKGKKRQKRTLSTHIEGSMKTRSKRFAAAKASNSQESPKTPGRPAGRKSQANSGQNGKSKPQGDKPVVSASSSSPTTPNTRRNLRRSTSMSNGSTNTEETNSQTERKSARVQQRNTTPVVSTRNIPKRSK